MERAFNRAYQIALYGYRDEFIPTSEYRKQKRLQVHSAILQEIQQAESRGKETNSNLDCLNHPPRIWQIALFLTKVYHIKFNRILFKKAYDFLDDFGEASL